MRREVGRNEKGMVGGEPPSSLRDFSTLSGGHYFQIFVFELKKFKSVGY